MKVTVIDYGLSNLLSVRRALEHCGAEVDITSSRRAVLEAKALCLPGVGAFKDGMDGLAALSLADAICEKAQSGTPLLGICLGMQMLFDESEEFGTHAGLGLIPGRVVQIPAADAQGAPQRVPHIGWSALRPAVRRACRVRRRAARQRHRLPVSSGKIGRGRAIGAATVSYPVRADGAIVFYCGAKNAA